MRTLLMAIILLSFYRTAYTQEITGSETICYGMTEEYTFSDTSCHGEIGDVEWFIGGNIIIMSDPFENTVTVSTGATGEGGTLYVAYTCTYGDTLVIEEELSFEITVLKIEEPLFWETELYLYCSEDTVLRFETPEQPGEPDYEWTFPECFSIVSGGENTADIGTDKAGQGEICLTVSYPECATEVTDCIEVVRRCLPYKVYTSDITSGEYFTSVEQYINTVGDVSTDAVPYVEFRAGEVINLAPGFYGAPNFLAHIAPCLCKPEDSTGCFKSIQFTYDQQTGPSKVAGGKRQQSSKVYPVGFAGDFLKVYPNPTNSQLTVEIENVGETKQGTLFLYNAIGKLLQQLPVTSEKMNLDLSAYDNGIYLVSYSNGKSNNVVRVSKTN